MWRRGAPRSPRRPKGGDAYRCCYLQLRHRSNHFYISYDRLISGAPPPRSRMIRDVRIYPPKPSGRKSHDHNRKAEDIGCQEQEADAATRSDS
jgi:hypothetical protein